MTSRECHDVVILTERSGGRNVFAGRKGKAISQCLLQSSCQRANVNLFTNSQVQPN